MDLERNLRKDSEPNSHKGSEPDQDPWSFFDEIVCINLLERDDRYHRIKEELSKINLSKKVKFFRTKKHPTDPVEGCFTSHREVIRQAYNKGYNNVLVFEDDIEINLSPEIFFLRLNECLRFLKANSWDIFYLGCIPEIIRYRTTQISQYRDIYQVHALGGHAYVLSRNYMEKIINMPYFDHAIDTIYSGCNKAYAIIPSLFYQGNQGTDIQKMDAGAIKDKCVRLIESYAVNINVPILQVSFLLVFGFILIIILYLVNPKQRSLFLFLTVILLLIILLSLRISNI